LFKQVPFPPPISLFALCLVSLPNEIQLFNLFMELSKEMISAEIYMSTCIFNQGNRNIGDLREVNIVLHFFLCVDIFRVLHGSALSVQGSKPSIAFLLLCLHYMFKPNIIQ
jgi:hypothetical protein